MSERRAGGRAEARPRLAAGRGREEGRRQRAAVAAGAAAVVLSRSGCPTISPRARCLPRRSRPAAGGARKRSAELREPGGEDAPGAAGGPLAEDGCGERGREQHGGTGRGGGGEEVELRARGSPWGGVG